MGGRDREWGGSVVEAGGEVGGKAVTNCREDDEGSNNDAEERSRRESRVCLDRLR